MNTPSIPIVFIHTGYSDYMEYSLRQAKHTNPDSEIILLGDESNNRFHFVTHVNIKDYFNGAAEFAKIYKHYSTNPYNYELFCFQRWFILRDFLTVNKLKEVFVCDTDVLIYTDIGKILKKSYKNIEFGCLSDNKKKCYNAAISFWKDKKLTKFCQNIFSLYSNINGLKLIKNKWIEVKKSKNPGSFSDMDAVKNFTDKYIDKNKFVNFCKNTNNSVFDNDINSMNCFKSDEYKFRLGIKNIFFKEKKPFCYNLLEKRNIRFNCLHMQGPAKYLISKFYTGKSFHGKILLDIKFSFANISAFLYKILKIRYHFAWLFNIIFKLKK